MPKITIDRTVKVRIYDYLEEKIEDAVSYGHRRAYKHTDTPTKEQVETEITSAIMTAICDVFDFEGG